MTAERNARRTCFADSPCMMRGWKLLLHLILGHKPSYSLFSFWNLSRISRNSISRRSTTNENSGWRQSLGSIPRKSFPFSPSAKICLSDERTAKDAFLCTPFIENWNFLSVTWERWWAVRKPKARNFGRKNNDYPKRFQVTRKRGAQGVLWASTLNFFRLLERPRVRFRLK